MERPSGLGFPWCSTRGQTFSPAAGNRYSAPMAADDVAVDFPKLKLILAHAGRPLFMPTAIFLARRHANVHLDLSGIPPRNLLEYLPRLEDLAGKCLWGTDYPSPGVLSMRRYVEDFLGLPISDSAKQRILFDNADRLILLLVEGQRSFSPLSTFHFSTSGYSRQRRDFRRDA